MRASGARGRRGAGRSCDFILGWPELEALYPVIEQQEGQRRGQCARCGQGVAGTEDLGWQACLCYTVKYTISPMSSMSGLWLVMLFLSFCHTLNPRTFLWLFTAAVGFQSNRKVHAGGRRPFLNEITDQLAGVSQRKLCISWYFASFPVSYSSLLLCLCLYLSVSLFLFIFWTELD